MATDEELTVSVWDTTGELVQKDKSCLLTMEKPSFAPELLKGGAPPPLKSVFCFLDYLFLNDDAI